MLSTAILVMTTASLVAPDASPVLGRWTGPYEVPAAWHGVWEITTVIRLCGTGDSLATFAEVDTVCSDGVIDDGSDLTCSEWSITDTDLHYFCSVTTDLGDGCAQTVVIDAELHRFGDTVQGSALVTHTYTGSCIYPSTCVTQQLSGTRVSSAGDLCEPNPVHATSLGAIKSRYR